jgi:hypothetical protein
MGISTPYTGAGAPQKLAITLDWVGGNAVLPTVGADARKPRLVMRAASAFRDAVEDSCA